MVGVGGNFDGPDGARVVGADGEGHVALNVLQFIRFPDTINTISGQEPDGVKLGSGWPTRQCCPSRRSANAGCSASAPWPSKAGVALSTIYLLEAARTERATFKVMRAVSDALGVAPESIAEFRRTMDATRD